MNTIQIGNDTELQDLFTSNKPEVGDLLTITNSCVSFQDAKIVTSIDGLINIEVSNDLGVKVYSLQKYAHRIVVFKSADHQLSSVYEIGL